MTLGDFLNSAANDRGPWNCSTLAADWCVALGHPDFAAEWRDMVDPVACETAPAEAGGLVALWERGIGEALPFLRSGSDAPSFMWMMRGDIAVVSGAGLEAGAIWTGEKWAIRASRGLHFIPRQAVAVAKAWRP